MNFAAGTDQQAQMLAALLLERENSHASLCQQLRAWTDDERAAFLARARKEKCFSNLAAVYQELGFLDAQGERDLANGHLRNQSGFALSAQLPANILLLKGAALARHYPKNTPRDMMDIDLLVRDNQALFALSELLRRHEYALVSATPWRIEPAMRIPISGGVRMVKGSEKKDVEVEIHFGEFSTSVSTGINVELLWQFAEPGAAVGSSAHVLSPTGQMCLILADYGARTDAKVTVRHIADVIFFLHKHENDIDFAYVRQFVQQHSLCNGLLLLRNKLEQCGIRQLPQQLQQLLNSPLMRLAPAQRSLLRRAFHAPLPQQQQTLLGRSLRAALHWYRTKTFNLSQKNARHPFLLWSERPGLTAWLARKGMRMMMTPLSRQLSEDFSFKQVGDDWFCFSPLGIFFMNQHGVSTDEQRYQLFMKLSKS